MTTLKIIKQTLASRYLRRKATGGVTRTIDVKHQVVRPKLLEGFGWALKSAIKGFANWVAREIEKGWINAGNIFNWLWNGVTKIAQFDWNQTDEQLKRLQESNNVRVFSIWGGTLGRAAGWLTAIGVGYGISYVLPVIGGATLARNVALGASKEAIDDTGYALKGAIEQTFATTIDNSIIGAYMLARSTSRDILLWLHDNTPVKLPKETVELLKKRGKESLPVFTFSNKIEETIEAIPDQNIRAFVQSFVDQAVDSFVEGGMVVAQQIDQAYGQHRLANTSIEGKKRTVRLIPDKNRKSEQMLLTGSQKQVQENVVETLNNYRLIANRDVGQIVGQPAEEYLSAKPLRRQLTIIMKKGKKQPPWNINGKKCQQVTITIPDAITGLSWRRVKEACKPYTWGKFRATANLDNGRQMAIYASNKSEAERVLKRFLTLSTAKPLSISVTEEVEKKNIALKKEPVQVFPAYATLLVRLPTTGEGREFLDGSKLADDLIRVDLWMDQEPKGVSFK